MRLYRARLDAVFGSRLLMIEHVGRSSGLRRYVVLEVIDRPSPDCFVVVAGFGHRAQWFRNVEANPHVRVYLGSRTPVTRSRAVSATTPPPPRSDAVPTPIRGPGSS